LRWAANGSPYSSGIFYRRGDVGIVPYGGYVVAKKKTPADDVLAAGLMPTAKKMPFGRGLLA